MRRKELKKEIREFSRKTNFYELGLISKLLKYREKEEIRLKKLIPTVKCPYCGSTNISIDNEGGDYSFEDFLTCNDCWESFDDEYGYIDSYREYDCLCWGYGVDVELHFETPNINKYEWKQRCRNLILEELKNIKN